MKLRAIMAMAALPLLQAPATAQDPASLPVHTAGRVIVEPDGSLTFGWPGVYFEGRFRGTGFRVRFDAPAEHMRLMVDGAERAVFKRAAQVDAVIGGLTDAEHVVRLEKLTESQAGGGRFYGFSATAGGSPLPPRPRPRQIEFIGDSYTVGYGNTSPKRECTVDEVHDTTDTQQGFAARVGRSFDADYRVVAYSGFGIVRNYDGGNADLSLPAIYTRLKPDDRTKLETNIGAWRPRIIVINLGTNDFSTPVRSGERWKDADALRADYRARYAAFVRTIARRQPQAHFLLMASDAFHAEVDQIGKALAADLPGRITITRFGGLDLAGCHWHPSIADDARLAEAIALSIEQLDPTWRKSGEPEQRTTGAR
jgi:lysophospholipase L1-like esterase